MRHVALLTGFVAVSSLAACQAILGVDDIPTASPDAGKGVDAGHDARSNNDATAESGPHRDANVGVDAYVKPGSTRCAANGQAMETYEAEAGWGSPVVCGGSTPICLGEHCACEPGAGECAGQTFERCGFVPDGGLVDGAATTWLDGGVCPGTCTLSGCGPVPASCADGLLCSQAEDGGVSCCTSNEVPGGAFVQGYDGITVGYNGDTSHRAQVSAFRLDRYEVTVGRFTEFIASLNAGWLPASGSGKHTHLNGGRGLVDLAQSTDAALVYEPGWDQTWNTQLASLAAEGGATALLSCGNKGTWGMGGDENPISCVTWFEAYAFCIWDGGFLPSEAEWGYAAAGASEQRVYPWGPSLSAQKPHGPPVPSCSNADYTASSGPCGPSPSEPLADLVGSFSAGDSLWGPEDMAGNVVEWTLDVYDPALPRNCPDCTRTELPDASSSVATSVPRVQKGGSFVQDQEGIRVAPRGQDQQGERSFVAGMRCARVP